MKLIIYFTLIALGLLFVLFITFNIFVPLQQEFQEYVVLIKVVNFWTNFYIGYRMFNICKHWIKQLNK